MKYLTKHYLEFTIKVLKIVKKFNNQFLIFH